MKTYNVVRRSTTGEAPDQAIRIWDGENLLWERQADSFVERDGQMVKLSDLPDVEIVELYRRANE